MLKQSPSRNQRSKGIKVKHVLQICLLLAICIWLLYQIKHSHDKKKALEASTEKISEMGQSDHEILKFGRKDLNPRVVETATENEIQEEEGTEEEEEEEEENTHEDEEEEESKPEESEDEGRGGGDDEIDERDQERAEEEAERGEDFVDEEERDREEKESEKKQGQINHLGSSEDQDHDVSNRITQEAREEQYKGDDASSAVFRDTQTISTETEDRALGNSNEEEQVEIREKNGLEEENKSNSNEEVNVDQNDSGLKVREGEITENNTSVIATASEGKGNEITLPELEDGSHLKSTLTMRPNDKPENNNSMAVNGGTPGSSLQNGADILLDSTRDQNVTVETPTSKGYDSNLQTVVLEQTENSDTTVGGAQSDSNATLSTTIRNADEGNGADSSSNSEPVLPQVQTMKSDATVGTEDSSASLTTNENAGAVQREKSNANTGTEESLASSIIIKNSDAVLSDPIDSSDSWKPQEEK